MFETIYQALEDRVSSAGDRDRTLSYSLCRENPLSPTPGSFSEDNKFYDLIDEVGEADFTSEVRELVYGTAAEDAAELSELNLLTTVDYTEPDFPAGSYWGLVWDEEEERVVSPLLPLYHAALYHEEADYFSLGTVEPEMLEEGWEEAEEPATVRTSLEKLLDEE